MHAPAAAAPAATTMPTVALLLYAGAILLLGWVVLVFVPAFKPVFEALEVQLPMATTWAMDLAFCVRTPVMLLVAVLVFLATIMPFARGQRDQVVGRRYLMAAIVLFVISVLLFAAVQIPVIKLQAGRGSVPVDSQR